MGEAGGRGRSECCTNHKCYTRNDCLPSPVTTSTRDSKSPVEGETRNCTPTVLPRWKKAWKAPPFFFASGQQVILQVNQARYQESVTMMVAITWVAVHDVPTTTHYQHPFYTAVSGCPFPLSFSRDGGGATCTIDPIAGHVGRRGEAADDPLLRPRPLLLLLPSPCLLPPSPPRPTTLRRRMMLPLPLPFEALRPSEIEVVAPLLRIILPPAASALLRPRASAASACL